MDAGCDEDGEPFIITLEIVFDADVNLIVPDEDVSDNSDDGIRAYKNGESIVYLDKIDKNNIKSIYVPTIGYDESVMDIWDKYGDKVKRWKIVESKIRLRNLILENDSHYIIEFIARSREAALQAWTRSMRYREDAIRAIRNGNSAKAEAAMEKHALAQSKIRDQMRQAQDESERLDNKDNVVIDLQKINSLYDESLEQTKSLHTSFQEKFDRKAYLRPGKSF